MSAKAKHAHTARSLRTGEETVQRREGDDGRGVARGQPQAQCEDGTESVGCRYEDLEPVALELSLLSK